MSKKTRKFKTEVQQLLDLVIHSLYSKKEIFLRELISNSSDAIDRLRFESLTDTALADAGREGRIRIACDKAARTLTVSDNGIGMSAEELDAHLGTIANSGTRNFLESLRAAKKAADMEFIGQFGVGFYASFMVADRVEVLTRRAGAQTAFRWASTGDGAYTVEESERAEHGSDVVLHLREGMDEYLDEWRIREIVKRYSDYIAYPIAMEVEREEGQDADRRKVRKDETLNAMKSIWKKSKSEVSDEEYKEFFHHVSHDFSDPLRWVHFAAEGTAEFRALVYIPSQAPFDLYFRETRHGLHLYVRNVLITEDCRELLPEYLRFVKGVVDSSDLPLNVSREMLQDDAIIRRIRKGLVARILSELQNMKDGAAEDYLKFHAAFGRILKEGVHFDADNVEKLKDLVLFRSTHDEGAKPVSLRDYRSRMPSAQKEIYFLAAESLENALGSPHLEACRARKFEVLLLTDSIDEFVVQRLREYDGCKLHAVDRGALDLGETGAAGEAAAKADATEFADLLTIFQERLTDDIKEVRLSKRLTDSVACVVADENAIDPAMERMMRAMSQDVPKQKRILELNPRHALLPKLKEWADRDRNAARLAEYVELIYDQALLAAGAPVRNPSRFARLLSELMTRDTPA